MTHTGTRTKASVNQKLALNVSYNNIRKRQNTGQIPIPSCFPIPQWSVPLVLPSHPPRVAKHMDSFPVVAEAVAARSHARCSHN